MNKQEKVREILIERFEQDLIGPHDGDLCEEIYFARQGPDSEYFTGKLYSKRTKREEDENAQLLEETGRAQVEQVLESEIQKKFDKPSSMGLSFFVRTDKEEFELNAYFSAGMYKSKSKKVEVQKKIISNLDSETGLWEAKDSKGETLDLFETKEEVESFAEKQIETQTIKYWTRQDFKDIPSTIKISLKKSDYEPKNFSPEIDGLSINYKVRRWRDLYQVSIFVLNEFKLKKTDKSIQSNEKTFFQTQLRISSTQDSRIVKIPSESAYFKEDKLNDMLFRDRESYAVGHTCSADWFMDDDKNINVVTTWLPKYFIPDVDETGHSSIDQSYSADELSNLNADDLISKLQTLPNLYAKWISEEKKIVDNLRKDQKEIALMQINLATNILKRMEESLSQIKADSKLMKAFQLANRAMVKVYEWKANQQPLCWRPFQLGFVLLSLESSINPGSKHRNTSDLLWFPTGGGKTEAYLLLMSIILFFRRLKKGGLDFEDGLAVFTRYTLRALTLDQFKRLVGTICACEIVRRTELNETRKGKSFSIGMWVGKDATPNLIDDAIKEIDRIKVLKNCPCCGNKLKIDKETTQTACDNSDCEIASSLGDLPFYVIDEQIYNVIPSVLIGTVDKFVQIIRRPKDARRLFSLDRAEIDPPDLIIQDELHLISGPLGSVVGAIEMIIEAYCSNQSGIGPKVIGSTATIQRAEEQIRGLYSKDHNQFPVNISNVDNSFFAVTKKDSPGRIYMGVSTACSSEQYILQSVSAILLQAIKSKKFDQYDVDDLDPYSTLVAYFNNLKQLGAATVLLQEDTKQSISGYANRRKESVRNYDAPEELTGSADQSKLEETLTRLESRFNSNDHISVLVASVMISVGLDISRLGLMVVDSQPKTISEYIQATSRVGRGKIPGLILTVFNEYRPRDKSHFENFKNLHLNLYRFVENTSVTPYAPRARQKLLPAVLISLSIKELDLKDSFGISHDQASIIRKEVIPKILDRIKISDHLEVNDAQEEMEEILIKWLSRGSIPRLWVDQNELESLFISQEAHAAKKAVGLIDGIAFPAPNSARNVEASVTVTAKGLVSTKYLQS